MTTNKKMTQSSKKFIRREKAEIRHRVLDPKKQEEEIKNLYVRVGTNKTK